MQSFRALTLGSRACHEGNYAMRNRLSAARAREARDAAAKNDAGVKK